MATQSSAPAAANNGNDQQAAAAISSGQERPVEMTDLQPSSAQQAQSSSPPSSQQPDSSIPPPSSSAAAAAAQSETSPQQNQQDAPAPTISTDPSAPTQSSDPDPPAATQGIAAAESTPPQPTVPGPVLAITLLLTNGARHPYKIDDKYLKKRNVTADDDDPFTISVYTLKELIWRDWREEWEHKPTSPGSIRLIHFGRMLDDKSPLKECRFQAESPNVVHMTVKPQEIVDEEEQNTKGGKGGRGDRDGEERTAGCRCTIL